MKELELIEQIIDAKGINGTLKLIAQVCYEKADHLRSNWQDEKLAKIWEHFGKRVEKSIKSFNQ